MDLNDHVPCVCDVCRDKLDTRTINLVNTMYFKDIPEVCPLCGTTGSVRPVVRICLVKAVEGSGTSGNYKASDPAKRQLRKTMPNLRYWTFYCGRSQDEHNPKRNMIQHTRDPNCCNCAECLVQYNKTLELANYLIRERT